MGVGRMDVVKTAGVVIASVLFMAASPTKAQNPTNAPPRSAPPSVASAVDDPAWSSREHWYAFDWQNAEKSALWLQPGWIAEKSGGSAEFDQARSKPIRLGDLQATAQVAVNRATSPPHDRALLMAKGGTTSAPCEKLLAWSVAAFGRSAGSRNSTQPYNGGPNFFEDSWVWWDVGTTQITFHCLALSDSNRVKFGYFPVIYFDPLVPASGPSTTTPSSPVFVHCHLNYNSSGQSADYSFSIDSINKKVYRYDGSLIDGGVNVSDTAIQFSIGNNLRFDIARYSGTISIVNTKSNHSIATGVCESVNMDKPKF